MIMDWLTGAYLWVKAAHIIAVISWMAGLLYLPRLFVYHCDVAPGSSQSETFKVMERRLYRAIITPAMIAAWVFGLSLAITPGVIDWGSGWFYAKLVLVVGLSGLHGFLGRQVRVFAVDQNQRGARFFRLINEIPTVILILVVVLVVVKPF